MTLMIMMIQVFRDVTSRRLAVSYGRFGRSYCLHLRHQAVAALLQPPDTKYKFSEDFHKQQHRCNNLESRSEFCQILIFQNSLRFVVERAVYCTGVKIFCGANFGSFWMQADKVWWRPLMFESVSFDSELCNLINCYHDSKKLVLFATCWLVWCCDVTSIKYSSNKMGPTERRI